MFVSPLRTASLADIYADHLCSRALLHDRLQQFVVCLRNVYFHLQPDRQLWHVFWLHDIVLSALHQDRHRLIFATDSAIATLWRILHQQQLDTVCV